METVSEELKTIQDLLTKLQISESQAYQLVNQKLIPHHYLGTKIRFYFSEIDEWIKSGEAAKAMNRPATKTRKAV